MFDILTKNYILNGILLKAIKMCNYLLIMVKQQQIFNAQVTNYGVIYLRTMTSLCLIIIVVCVTPTHFSTKPKMSQN